MATASWTTGEGNFDTKFEVLNREIIQTFEELFQALEKRKHELLSRLSSMKAAHDNNIQLEEAIKQLRIARENAVSVMTSNLLGEEDLDPIRTGVDTQVRLNEEMNVTVQNVNFVEFRSFSQKIIESIQEMDLIELIPEYVGRENPILKKCAWGVRDGEIQNGSGIAFDKKTNEVYILDNNNHRIQVLSAEGDFLRSFGHDLLVDGWGICLSEDDVYVTDKVNFILQFDKEENFLNKAGSRGIKPGCFIAIMGLCYDEGFLYVCEASLQCIQIFDSELIYLKFFGPGVVEVPFDIKVHSNTIYILSQTENSIYCYSKDCQHLNTIQLKGQKESNTQTNYLAIDYKGNFIISNPSSEIHIFSPDGVLKHKLGKGHLNIVSGIALDNTNIIICVNSGEYDDCFQKY